MRTLWMKRINVFYFLLLFCFLFNTTSFAIDVDKTFVNTKTQAEQGDVDAQHKLGTMYDFGEGVAENKVEAVKWYRLAAEQGDASGQYALGTMYHYGEGVEENKVEAVKWYRLAAEQGDASGQYALGTMYHYGEGVEENKVEAVKWYRLAAEQSQLAAQNSLGEMYLYGWGITEDYDEAKLWFERSAKGGHADGQVNLAYLLEDGSGYPNENQRVNELYEAAKSQGHEGAAYIMKIGKKVGLKEKVEIFDARFAIYNDVRPLFLNMLEKSTGFAVEHYKLGMPYPELSIEQKKSLMESLFSCSDYLFHENWKEHFESYHNGHPFKATVEMLNTLTGAELSKNGCKDSENYRVKALNIDYNKLYFLVSQISKFDDSILVKWGQRLLFDNYASVDGDFGPNTCDALNKALDRPGNTPCQNTFQKEEILLLIEQKQK